MPHAAVVFLAIVGACSLVFSALLSLSVLCARADALRASLGPLPVLGTVLDNGKGLRVDVTTPCPRCGFCPTCGRKHTPPSTVWPYGYWPYVNPWPYSQGWPAPYQVTWTSNATQPTIGGAAVYAS